MVIRDVTLKKSRSGLRKMGIELRDYQLDAVSKLQNGNILCGGVGSGKSRTALAYYFKECGGGLRKKYEEIYNKKLEYEK